MVSNTVLVTGFEPFGGSSVNPSEQVARSLEGRLIAGRRVVARILPVETAGIGDLLRQAFEEERPELVVCTGLAASRTAVSLERVAVNVLDFEQPDNAGEARTNEPILRGGPHARLSPMPIAEILEAWESNGVPGYVSNSAGTYLCNQVLYEALGIAESVSPPVTAGFIHLPYLPEQAIAAGAGNSPSMSLELMTRAVELAIAATVPLIERRNAGRQAAAAGV
jgi:pyroglutamyl-peptidase